MGQLSLGRAYEVGEGVPRDQTHAAPRPPELPPRRTRCCMCGGAPPTGRMDRISEQYDLVIAQRIQNLIVVLDELLLLVFIELAGDGIGLVIFEPEAMQQRDQSRAAFVNEAEFLRDEGTDFPRRARQRGSDKGFQGFLHSTQKACAAAYVKTGEPLDARCTNSLCQPRIVSSFNKNLSDFFTAPPVVRQHQSVRPPRQARRRRAIARQRDRERQGISPDSSDCSRRRLGTKMQRSSSLALPSPDPENR